MFRLRATNTNPETGSALLPDELRAEFASITDLLSAVYKDGADWAQAVAAQDPISFYFSDVLDLVFDNPGHVANGLVIDVMVDGEWRELLGLTHRSVQTTVTENRIL
jgi:hypothetical protein